jgi:CD109 antigen
VNGEMTVKATRYVGIWEEFASVTAAVVDGAADFELAAPGYVAGVAEAGGNGNVQLDITVEERNTGYVEETSELVTVAVAPVTVQLIPETPSFKPGLPFNVLVVTETPDGQPVDATVSLGTAFLDENFNQIQQERSFVDTARGVGTATVVPPEGAQRLSLDGSVGDAYAYKEIGAAYSPSGNFIHVSQLPPTELRAGVEARFQVDSTSEARAFYYEVVSRDRVVFTAWSESPDFGFEVTPAMAGANKLLVYQVLPNSEVAADFIPFDVEAAYPHAVEATFSDEESQPGDEVTIDVQAQGTAKVGLAAVDRSVFILAENRLNLAQVFDEIERLYQEPQAELHEFEFEGPIVVLPGAEDTISDAGLLVMTNHDVPEGEEIESPWMAFDGAGGGGPAVDLAAAEDEVQERALNPLGTPAPSGGVGGGAALAEVQRVRQFFPETWIWDEVTTDADGKASLSVESPDSITTWDLRAVAISPEHGLGVAEAEHRVFQPFFLSADLPYSAIRGEEFPLKVSLYNYTETDQEFFVEIEPQAWFELLDAAEKSVTVAPNDTGGVEFMIRTTGVGTQTVKVTARSTDAADAVIKSMIVEPEGVQREYVESGVLAPDSSRTIDLTLPPDVVPDSARASVAITGSLLSQTIQGLDQLLQMPFGCGEQNMLLFAPDAYILKYLQGTSQLTPEIRAKAETLLITGYQRELTYRRSDGSFSAFGDQDPEGSMFLTSFVLRTFNEAKELIYVDEAVLTGAAQWIASHQNADGSFEDVGFVHHQELLGGIQGRDALTAYATIAMLEGGVPASADKAVAYLEGRLGEIEEPYSLALVTYALELADSGRAGEAYDKLMAAAEEDDDGLHWSGGGSEPLPLQEDQFAPFPGQMSGSSDIEATGYATLALIEHGDPVNAGRAAKWLVGHRNSMGGFGSTQDTVVALQALTRYAADAASDTEMTVTVSAGGKTQDVQITAANFDVLQTVEIPAGVPVTLRAEGKGQAVFQAVSRFNLPEAEEEESVFDITVDYDTTQVSVNDTVTLDVSLTFQPPVPGTAGMIVLDVSVPTGFAPVTETLDALVAQDAKVKRYDVAGRKVILYIEDMAAGETIGLSFDVVAQYPVQGKGATSQAYSYYTPEWRGETISEAVTVE